MLHSLEYALLSTPFDDNTTDNAEHIVKRGRARDKTAPKPPNIKERSLAG